jgi:hypothetical protein
MMKSISSVLATVAARYCTSTMRRVRMEHSRADILRQSLRRFVCAGWMLVRGGRLEYRECKCGYASVTTWPLTHGRQWRIWSKGDAPLEQSASSLRARLTQRSRTSSTHSSPRLLHSARELVARRAHASLHLLNATHNAVPSLSIPRRLFNKRYLLLLTLFTRISKMAKIFPSH